MTCLPLRASGRCVALMPPSRWWSRGLQARTRGAWRCCSCAPMRATPRHATPRGAPCICAGLAIALVTLDAYVFFTAIIPRVKQEHGPGAAALHTAAGCWLLFCVLWCVRARLVGAGSAWANIVVRPPRPQEPHTLHLHPARHHPAGGRAGAALCCARVHRACGSHTAEEPA